MLDGLDEDFEIKKMSEESSKIADELFEQTKRFGHVLISSRNQFFRENKTISEFIEKITLGNESYDYQTIFLCPFSDKQIEKFLQQKFIGEELNKAYQIIKYIGKDSLHRQLLIAHIDRLFPILDNPDKIKEAKTYYLFEALIKNWKAIEQGKIRSKMKEVDDDRVKAFEQTFLFCRILAKAFFGQERDSYQGFSFEEIEQQLVKHNIEKRKILTNRTFLILDTDDRYRFAHQSIYDFFLSESLYTVLASHSVPISRNPKISPFAKKLYQQRLFLEVNTAINKLTKEELACDVQYTCKQADINQYAKDIRFEPFFLLEEKTNGQKVYTPYRKREWIYFSELKTNIEECKKIIGVKIICTDPDESDEIRLKKRQKCADILGDLYYRLPNLIHFDNSEIKNRIIKTIPNLSIINRRGALTIT